MLRLHWILAAVLAILGAHSVEADEAPLKQEWEFAAAMKTVAAKGTGRAGVALHVGDSITYASPYAAWARAGEGRTEADRAALKWMHAGANDESDGWYLATFDHPAGGRSYTACSGIRADEVLAGGKRGMPKFAELLDEYKPQIVVVMLGTNDASAGRTAEAFLRDVETMVEAMTSRGVVPIVSTIPPHVHKPDLAKSYNEAIRTMSKRRSLPLIDYEREILSRRPADWDGTLLTRGDVHPTAKCADGAVTAASAPTPENLRSCGYLLRGWLSVNKITEVKAAVFDAPAGPPAKAWVPKAPSLGKPAAASVRVTNVQELYRAVESAKAGTTIMVADGQYAMPQYLEIRADRVTLRGESGDRDRVVLDGAQSRSGEVVGVGGCAGVMVADLTIQNARTNAFKINSDRFATKVTLRNCVIHNAWQRGVKGVAVRAGDRERFRPSDCRIEYCLFYNDRAKRFEDDPDDTAANFGGNYIGGIDAMYARGWTICDNVFVGIHGRTGEARGAVFLWQGAERCAVERNVIVDCDSGICLGNSFKPADVAVHCTRCVVRNNFVTRCPEQGILADYTRDCRIVHNTVFEPGSRFRRLIRLVHDNDGLVVANNLLGGAPVLVETRSDVSLSGNLERDLAKWCVDVANGDLHLKPDAPAERANAVEGVSEDFDRQRRSARPDVGADESAE